LSHVYAPDKFDQPQFVCDMEYFYSRLLNFKTPCRHYESKPAYFNVCHNLKKCRKRVDFAALLRVATSETHFIFDGKMYIQHNGVAMGAPLDPIIGDIFISHLEQTLMDQHRQIGVC